MIISRLLAVLITVSALSVIGCASTEPAQPYDGSWESLQTMPVLAWFDDGKIGIFIHWGPSSVIGHKKGGAGYAEHVPKLLYDDSEHRYPYMTKRWGAMPPEFGYKDIIPEFKAENWNPDEWAALFAQVGARYVAGVHPAPDGERRPAKVKRWTHHLEYTVQGSFKKWDEYCASLNMTSPEAVAEKIIKYYSLKYSKDIDGWWFDHAKHGDPGLHANAARAGNPNAVVSFNVTKQGQVVRNAEDEDVAFGHPTPLIRHPASWEGNTGMIRTIEKTPYVDGVLGHIFMPMQQGWWKNDAVFTTEKAIDWTLRVVKAKGAFTWAVALDASKEKSSQLAEKQFAQLLEINRQIRELRKNEANVSLTDMTHF